MGDEYTDATYGGRIADVYDERYGAEFQKDTEATVDFLKNETRSTLVGTGRVHPRRFDHVGYNGNPAASDWSTWSAPVLRRSSTL